MSSLRIKRFTERVIELFSITPIADFANQFEYDGLVKDARAVLNDLAPIRREIRGPALHISGLHPGPKTPS